MSDILLALALCVFEALALVFAVFLLLVDNWGEAADDGPAITLFAVAAALAGGCSALLLRARRPVSGVTQGLVAVGLACLALVGLTA